MLFSFQKRACFCDCVKERGTDVIYLRQMSPLWDRDPGEGYMFSEKGFRWKLSPFVLLRWLIFCCCMLQIVSSCCVTWYSLWRPLVSESSMYQRVAQTGTGGGRWRIRVMEQDSARWWSWDSIQHTFSLPGRTKELWSIGGEQGHLQQTRSQRV